MTLHELWSTLVPSSKRTLGIYIVLIMVLHGAAFFIFKMASEPITVSNMPRQPRVSLLTSSFTNSENGKELQSWLDMMNPTLVAMPPIKPTEKDKQVVFPDSTETWPQIANPLPAIPSRAKPDRPMDSLGDIAQQAERFLGDTTFATPMPIMVETPPVLSSTQMVLVGDIAARTILRKEDLPQPRAPITLRSTELRLSVDRDGNVAHILIEESSGDSSVDVLAVKIVSSWRFASKSGATAEEWGKMTIFWDQQALPTPTQPVKP